MKSSIGQGHIGRLDQSPATLHHPRNRFSRRAFLAGTAAVIVSVSFARFASAATGSILNIVAHEDDDLLFLSPDLLHAIQSGRTVRTIIVTAGDAGDGASYWQSRESGSMAAYAQMSGVANSWTQSDAGVSWASDPAFYSLG